MWDVLRHFLEPLCSVSSSATYGYIIRNNISQTL
jgi:hypothetical protein